MYKCGSDGKESACKVEDPGSIPVLGRSPGEGNGNPLQYSCLENPMDGEAWQAPIHGVAKSQTWLTDFTFTFSHIQMWELDHKEGWAPENWSFWTVVLEKTLESTLDCKEIKPVNPKGNQSWISIGRTDAEDETPIPWPPDVKSWLIGKHPDAGKDWRQEEKGMKGWDGWMASLTQRTWVWANSGRQERTGKPGMLQSTGSKIVGHDLATEQQQSAGRSCSISQVIWEKGKFPPNTLQDIAEKWKPA